MHLKAIESFSVRNGFKDFQRCDFFVELAVLGFSDRLLPESETMAKLRCVPWLFVLLIVVMAGCGGGANTSDKPDAGEVYSLSAKSEVFDLRGNPADVGVDRDGLARSNLTSLITDLTTFEAGSKSSHKQHYTELLKSATELQTTFEAAKFKWTADCEKQYQAMRALAEKLPAT